ncbi:MAG: M3 family metallopeptidase [Cytophagales bacterium]|nr:M3 family metallopeptidase [Cytophagales bacterium]
MNPLLSRPTPNALTDFSAIRPEHIAPAVDELLNVAEAALDKACSHITPATWRDLSLALDVATERLGVAWGAISHLNGVADTPELRAAYNEALPKVTQFFTALGSDERLYAKYKAIDPASLIPEQTQAHKNALRSFQLGGADLMGAAKERYAQIDDRLCALSQKFSENVLDSTEAFSYMASEAEMAGVPDDVRLAAKARFDSLSDQQGLQSGYVLTLKAPCYMPVLQFATNSALRERLYKAYATRASDQGDAKYDNSTIITEMLALKHEQAQLLGMQHHAEVSLAPKMAASAQEVVTFLRDLASRAKPYAIKDVAEMRDYARTQLNINDPAPWDWTFISERLKEARYAYSESEVKNYFQLPKVLDGLFAKIESLFDVQIVLDQTPTWNERVCFYRIVQNGQLLAQFYLDTAARNGKRGGAWMDDARGRWLRPDTNQLQTPVAHLVCNFADGTGDKPALLTHDDVITLFHEFGHGLHHMLTRVNERDVAGISGVEWDAVELPSQFMENFCWEWQVVKAMSAHTDTGEAMPEALFQKMLAAKNYQTGLATMRQVEFSLFDMLLHSQSQAVTEPLQLLAEIRKDTAVLPAPDYSRTPHSFGHIFGGGYAAGYYSYKWAEVLSADCYAAFEEAALLGAAALKATGQRYLGEILQMGGSRPAIESFTAFRGRAPKIDALMRHQGMNL